MYRGSHINKRRGSRALLAPTILTVINRRTWLRPSRMLIDFFLHIVLDLKKCYWHVGLSALSLQ